MAAKKSGKKKASTKRPATKKGGRAGARGGAKKTAIGALRADHVIALDVPAVAEGVHDLVLDWDPQRAPKMRISFIVCNDVTLVEDLQIGPAPLHFSLGLPKKRRFAISFSMSPTDAVRSISLDIVNRVSKKQTPVDKSDAKVHGQVWSKDEVKYLAP